MIQKWVGKPIDEQNSSLPTDSMAASKGQIWERVTVSGMADRGMSVGRDEDGKVVFLQGGLPGDILDVRILRKRKGVWHGIAERIIEASPDRVEAPCRHFDDCGGCKWQDLDYRAQLQQKEIIVRDAFQRIAKVEVPDFRPILASEKIYHYRNKMEFSFSNQRWKTKQEVSDQSVINAGNALGLHPPKFFNKVVDIDECLLQDERSNELRNFIRDYARSKGLSFFDPVNHQGFLRNVIIRNTKAGLWMVVMSFFYEDEQTRTALLKALVAEFPDLTSVHYVINTKKNDTLFDQDIICYHGKDHLVEKLGNISYKIRPKSFFQTNPYQAERLYEITRAFCDFRGHETVYDLYTGTGSIALFVASQCREVIGVEEVADAIKDAKENAIANQIDNATFYVGDVKKIFSSQLLGKHGHADILITDPPRGGMHENVIRTILDGSPERIVYISCNPATQARDIGMLADQYRVEKMQPVDMFPHTSHIENVAQLAKRE